MTLVRRSSRIGSFVLALGFGLAGPVRGHDFWIEPSLVDAKSGTAIDCTLRVGDFGRGDVVPRSASHIVSFRAIDARGESDVEGAEGSAIAGSTTLRAAGTTVIAYDSRPTRLELDAFRFALYLREAGLDAIVKERNARNEAREPGREAFARCAKALVRVDGDSAGFDRAVGFPLELVPRTDPFALDDGGSMRVALLQDGKPVAGTRVGATALGGERTSLFANTDEHGEVTFELPRAGRWMIHAVTMQRAEPGADVDWRSTWASLTFTIPSTERASPPADAASADPAPARENSEDR